MCMAALFSGALTSCNESSFLNLSDPNYFTESNFWKDKADAESALAAAYSPIKGAMYGYFGAFDGWLNLNGRGDDIYTIKGEEVPMWNIANFLNSPSTGNDPYGALYSGIQRANIVLRYIDPVSYTHLDVYKRQESISAKKKTEKSDREIWCDVMYRMAAPVLSNMSEGLLKQNMLVELSPTWDGRNQNVTYMAVSYTHLLSHEPDKAPYVPDTSPHTR